MDRSRRNFMTGSAVALGAVAGTLGSSKADAAEAADTMMVAACGLSCATCPLMKAKKCKGCGPGNKVSDEMAEMKKCPVLSCAKMKGIDYCGTGCKGFTKCAKMIGRPYDKSFMEKIATKMSS